jgi:hypothetical protein
LRNKCEQTHGLNCEVINNNWASDDMTPIKTLKQLTCMVQEIIENIATGNTNRAYSSIQFRSLSASHSHS